MLMLPSMLTLLRHFSHIVTRHSGIQDGGQFMSMELITWCMMPKKADILNLALLFRTLSEQKKDTNP